MSIIQHGRSYFTRMSECRRYEEKFAPRADHHTVFKFCEFANEYGVQTRYKPVAN